MSEFATHQQDSLELSTVEPTVLPIGEAVLKIHSRCNLNCDYCYVYNLGDQSYLEQPKEMSNDTVDRFADRLAEYLELQRPRVFAVTFHGGEPLLRSPKFIDRTVRTLRAANTTNTVLQFGMQTNGALLSDAHMETIRRNAISVGISLDGNQLANDRHRLTRGGKSSFDDVVRGIRQFDDDRYSDNFGGILSVVDIKNNPVETYNTLRAFAPPSIDFLLPHGNWRTPPPGLETREQREDAPYADWMCAVFDEWWPGDTTLTSIRYFESIIRTLTGNSSLVESIGGLASGGLVVLESDGSYELVDTLKSAPELTYKTGLNVRKHSLEQANQYMARHAQKMGATTLAHICEVCPVVRQCGGGYTPHRYNTQTKFTERSVYCLDLMQIIHHIRGRLEFRSRELKGRAMIKSIPEPIEQPRQTSISGGRTVLPIIG